MDEALQPGGTGDADVDRQAVAGPPQPAVPVDDRPRVETELGDDVEIRVGSRLEGVLFAQGREDRLVADRVVALRVAGDADRADAVAVEQPDRKSTRLNSSH